MAPDSDDDEQDWTKYADAGYASEYDPWSDLVELEEDGEGIDFEDDFEDFDNEELKRLMIRAWIKDLELYRHA